MIHLLLCWLLLLLELVKDTGFFTSGLTMLKKGHEPKSFCGQRLVCLRKRLLMHLGLRQKDLFALLLHCGQLHPLMEIVAIKVAEKLHLRPHKFMHRQERVILGSAKPTK
jgi:hypothetical protein